MPRLDDFEHRAAFHASDRSVWEGGPVSRGKARRIWASEVGQWLSTGYGPFSVDDSATGAHADEVGIYEPEGYPEPELGWFVVPEAEGKGYAFEAAWAARDHAYAKMGLGPLANLIDPDNIRSVTTAKRLGAEVDGFFDEDGKTLHIYRHPKPEAT